ncbi:MAG: DUF2235 domain-containing protein [Magnetococcales bacterium]|nr:DUF2235 domain-containing protein [Magnetococcales bacterium]
MALYAFDGTWNDDEPDPSGDTNVVKFRDYYKGTVNYLSGVGTRYGALGRIFGGVFGAGGQTRIEEMYAMLVENWKNGDHVIDIIGFSRGAALAVHFANVIHDQGIKIDEAPPLQSPMIRFLGVWDVVGSFGIPINFVLNFHDMNIGYDLTVPANVAQCYHAMALDERRQAFNVTRLNANHELVNVQEVWFRGVHSDVGGGGQTLLSNIALHWMMENAENCGVPVDACVSQNLPSDRTAPLSSNFDPIKNDRRTLLPGDQLHQTAQGVDLAIGDKKTFSVRAEEQYSWSGVRFVKGGCYRMTIAPDEKWVDGTIECGPEGWTSDSLPFLKEVVVEVMEFRRRCPKANWFEVIGSIGQEGDLFFRIGSGCDYIAPKNGEFFAFANDLVSMYGNNHGKIKVTIQRLASCEAGKKGPC